MKAPLHITALLSAQLLLSVSALVGQASITPANEGPITLTAEQIVNNLVQRNLERAQALSTYQGTRVYRLEYRGFPGSRSAEMVVAVKYRSPRTKEFTIQSENGSHLLIERVFHKLLESEKEALNEENQSAIALNRENYRFALLGYENKPSGPCYILSVEPLTKNKLLYRGRIWVDAGDFAVVQIEASPAKNPSFWTKETKIEQTYTKVGNFWLPLSNRSTSVIRLGGRADLAIDYRDYQITSGSALTLHTTFQGYR